MISVSSNIKEVAKRVPRALRRQIPFATSQALNDTARQSAMKDARRDAVRELDRPNPFTIKGFVYKKATKRHLVSSVIIERRRWEYMNAQVNGQVRTARGRGFPIQVTDAGIKFLKRNKYGNITRTAIARASKRRDTFWGTVNGTQGLWRRVGSNNRQLNLLAALVTQTTYRARFKYKRSVYSTVSNTFNKAFAKRMTAAIRTARL